MGWGRVDPAPPAPINTVPKRWYRGGGKKKKRKETVKGKKKEGRPKERDQQFFKREMRDRKRETKFFLERKRWRERDRKGRNERKKMGKNREEKVKNNRREILQRGDVLGKTGERKGSHQRSGEEWEVIEEEKRIPEKKNNHSCHRASSLSHGCGVAAKIYVPL